MKRLALVLLFCCAAGSALAYHTDSANESKNADSNASCNAAFHSGCPTDQTFSASSSGFAAPAGALGAAPLENLAIWLLLALAVGGRMKRFAVGRSRDTARRRNDRGPPRC